MEIILYLFLIFIYYIEIIIWEYFEKEIIIQIVKVIFVIKNNVNMLAMYNILAMSFYCIYKSRIFITKIYIDL